MLTDKQIADALDLIDDRYHGVITKYLQKVGKTINEIGHLNQSSINLLIQLRRMGVDTATIEKELQKVTRLTKQDIRTLYRKAAQEANTDARIEYLTKGVEPDSVRWESLVENIWRQTAGAMDNLANSSVITENYRDAIDDAVQAVTMGAADYNSVIRDTVKCIGRAGIQVEYESTYLAADGQLKHHKRRLDSAVRQNVLDGIRQVQQKAQELIGEEIGADGVDITAHPNSAPDHEPVQGRRFDMANFQLMQSGQDFEDVDGNRYSGFERPITQWRCRHLIFYILLGVTRRMYTDEQLRQWEEKNQKGCVIDGKKYTNYEATQLMRNLETEIRRQKDTAVLAKASGDDVLRRECQSNITKLTRKYDQVAQAAGLKKQMGKTYVEGFKSFAEDDAEAEKFFDVSGGDQLTSIVKRSTIKLENGFACFPDGDPLNENVKRVKPLKTYFDVAMHGTSSGVCFGTKEVNMSARLLASVIRHSEGYEGQKIRLLACSTGLIVGEEYCFAEELANALGVEVKAPNDELYISNHGRLSVGILDDGTFITFKPNQRGRVK